ncbi:transposase [Bacillus sp. DJP31]|uniref:transposase n=1 Tax=Bacillus sp. DJP31 TaxID=3409789 RepID=UPI003BB4B7E0
MFKHGRKEQQLSLDDRFLDLPKSIVESLQKSWADDFYRNIFLGINEDRFSVLYSEEFSRPNKPVNMLVSLLILKELHGLTDEQLIESLYFDYRYHYALGIENFEKERICINTLTNFRKRLVEHEVETKEDLLKIEENELSNRLAELIQLDRSMARMDSFMLSSSCKKLTRLELVYRVVQQMVQALNKLNPELVSESFQDYLKDGHKNQTLYHIKSSEAGSKLEKQFENAAELYRHIYTINECRTMKEFQYLTRLLQDQSVETDEGCLIPIEAKQLSPESLQNPSDPDATYRSKNGKGDVGYTVNVVEVRDQKKKVGMILSHDVQTNLYSDAQFGEEFIEQDPLSTDISCLSADGAYYRQSSLEKAEKKGIELNFSTMTGRKPAKDKLGVDQFQIDENDHITQCPAGHQPISSIFDSEKQVYQAKFSKQTCAACPFIDQCPIQQQKKANTVRFTKNKLQTDTVRSHMNGDRHRELSNFRAGIEGIISALRRGFKIDDIPVLGLVRSKIWVHTKILAFNFKAVSKYRVKTS